MAEYTWPEARDRRLLGSRISRLDGPAKVTGAARYSYDVSLPGLLHAKAVRCPHAHARITRLDTSRAAAMPGVAAVRVIQGEGSEIQWALDEVAVVAAETEGQAEDAARAVVVDYEVLPHFVDGEDRDGAPNVEVRDEESVGDADAALAAAETTHTGTYGIPTISHNCLEPHGQVCVWDAEGNLTAWCSTQAVTSLEGQYAEALEIPATRVRILAPYIGGGFGSKFSADRWGIECARLAKEAGRPVKWMLDRDAELTVAGDRPSAYAEITVAADAAGKLTAWRSDSWGSGGLAGAGSPPLPYVFEIPNRTRRHASVPTNVASSRAWRAPNHPQACFLTLAALDDLAAAHGQDPYDFLLANLDLTGRLEPIYRAELPVAAELMDWKAKWHPRGAAGPGPVKRGLGLSVHTWGGRGHRSQCEMTLHPDGSVEARLGSQDIGTGTRTVIAIVAAETLGLPVEAIHVAIGDSRFPPSGPSGGSTTVGGVSSSTRRAAVNALTELFRRVAPELDAAPEDLVAAGGRIGVRGANRSLSWEDACSLVGPNPLTVTGENPGEGNLTDSGVGGVQMAEVSVDTETGIVRVEKMVAVQDCGLIVDLKTAESQVYGGLIMGISYALSEEKIIDPVTGRMLNTDFESYKIAGIGEVGELVVHMMTGPGFDDRPVIGLGEPPVISPGAALSNAVANALGVRVPYLPLTPRRVLDALEAAQEKAGTEAMKGGKA
jgi:xanthine dehydrogenase YagR molybdenum-binding subunit